MVAAALCLNEGKKWLSAESGIDIRCTGCDKSEK
jgi:hypothetical protein